MRRTIRGVLALGLCVAAFGFTAGGAAAGQAPTSLPALKGIVSEAAPAAKIDYKDYCIRQYFKCRNYGDTSWEFRRCMKWRGCWEAYLSYKERHEENSCGRWRNICADRWGHGSGDYYGCLRYHGCN